jgi:hypothetical protein
MAQSHQFTGVKNQRYDFLMEKDQRIRKINSFGAIWYKFKVLAHQKVKKSLYFDFKREKNSFSCSNVNQVRAIFY